MNKIIIKRHCLFSSIICAHKWEEALRGSKGSGLGGKGIMGWLVVDYDDYYKLVNSEGIGLSRE